VARIHRELILHRRQPCESARFVLIQEEQKERPERHVAQVGLGVEIIHRPIRRHREVHELARFARAELPVRWIKSALTSSPLIRRSEWCGGNSNGFG